MSILPFPAPPNRGRRPRATRPAPAVATVKFPAPEPVDSFLIGYGGVPFCRVEIYSGDQSLAHLGPGYYHPLPGGGAVAFDRLTASEIADVLQSEA